jgi:hypothetical protein
LWSLEKHGGAHRPHNPDELHRGQAVAAAADGGDDDVEGAAAGEVGDEPGAEAIRGNLGVGLDDVALDMVMVTKEIAISIMKIHLMVRSTMSDAVRSEEESRLKAMPYGTEKERKT